MAKITLFAQVIRLIPREIIQRLVKKHGTDKHAKGFNSWSHLVTMMRLLHKGEWLCCFLPINTELCRGKVISTWRFEIFHVDIQERRGSGEPCREDM